MTGKPQPRSRSLASKGLWLPFLVSLWLGAFWTIGLLADVINHRDPNPLVLFVGILVAALVTGYVVYLRCPDFLNLPRPLPTGKFLFSLICHCLLGYIVLVPFCGVAGYLLTVLAGDPSASDATIGIVLIAIWLPLWWAPALGTLWTWRRWRT